MGELRLTDIDEKPVDPLTTRAHMSVLKALGQYTQSDSQVNLMDNSLSRAADEHNHAIMLKHRDIFLTMLKSGESARKNLVDILDRANEYRLAVDEGMGGPAFETSKRPTRRRP